MKAIFKNTHTGEGVGGVNEPGAERWCRGRRRQTEPDVIINLSDSCQPKDFKRNMG